jgi:predicted DsbA family dithiol-disulfide isomerase
MTQAAVNPVTKAVPLQIDVISDVVCPWCFIGKRQLEEAIALWKAQHPEAVEPIVIWHPFQLNPDLPPEGMDRVDYLEHKFGTRDGSQIYERVRAAAHNIGLDLKLDRITRQPNTLKAHSLITAALAMKCQTAVKESLLQAYFFEGADLTKDEELIRVAVRGGLNEDIAMQAVEDPRLHESIHEEDQKARSAGITGVPFFIINRQLPISGAQGAQALLQGFTTAAAANILLST